MKYPKTRIEKYDGGCLRIRWGYGATLRGFSLGLRDSLPGMSQARLIQAQINHDFEIKQQDPLSRDYSRYQDGSGTKPLVIKASKLFEEFTAHQAKAKGLAQSSIDARYVPVTRALAKVLDLPVGKIGRAQAEFFADYCLRTLQDPATGKARISLLVSCWDWGKDLYRLPDNPWVELTGRFKAKPKQKTPPFTAAEVRAILMGFRSSKHYSYLADFVEVLFGLGLRSGEAC